MFHTLSQIDKARIKLRSRELDWRIKELTEKIQRHQRDPDYQRSLHDWRKELLDARVERATGVSLHPAPRASRGIEYATRWRGIPQKSS